MTMCNEHIWDLLETGAQELYTCQFIIGPWRVERHCLFESIGTHCQNYHPCSLYKECHVSNKLYLMK